MRCSALGLAALADKSACTLLVPACCQGAPWQPPVCVLCLVPNNISDVTLHISVLTIKHKIFQHVPKYL